jgi:hypothetical protein
MCLSRRRGRVWDVDTPAKSSVRPSAKGSDPAVIGLGAHPAVGSARREAGFQGTRGVLAELPGPIHPGLASACGRAGLAGSRCHCLNG